MYLLIAIKTDYKHVEKHIKRYIFNINMINIVVLICLLSGCEIEILKLTALFEAQKYKIFAFFPD